MTVLAITSLLVTCVVTKTLVTHITHHHHRHGSIIVIIIIIVTFSFISTVSFYFA